MAGLGDELYEGESDAASSGINRAFPTHPTWDQRRQLAVDISNLAPPDLPGVLLLVRNYVKVLEMRELLPHEERALPWETKQQQHQALPSAESLDPIQLQCGVRLDDADDELLRRLRQYVDDCYVPHFVPKENCRVCEGLWSCGRVLFCGNDACSVRVHEECFGVVVRERDDGPWRCPSCLLGKQLMCAVCMQSGGALKPLAMPENANANEEQKWVHVICALAIPELVMRDVPTMEPVDGFEEIENGRFRYLCAICRKRGGASIICEHENCNVGVHPQCAADAGLMIGNEGNLLGVYCEKHLPTSRIPGAKRWISDEDLVEEIMSEYSIDDDFDTGEIDEPHYTDAERFAFILESTPYLHCKQKVLGARATLHYGPAPYSAASNTASATDITRKVFAGTKVNANAYAPPAMVFQGMSTQRPMAYPKSLKPSEKRVGLPKFPHGKKLVGAIVDYLAKTQDEWQRARVLQYDREKKMHLVQIVTLGQKLWAELSVGNTTVLYLPDEENLVDGPIVKLTRPLAQGSMQWRPKPRQFAPAS